MQSRARLAEPRPTYDLAWRSPRAWAEGQWQWPGAWGQALALGSRAVGEALDLNREHCLWGKVPSLAKVAAQRRPLRLLALFSSSFLRWCWLFWVCIRALWALANSLPSRPFFFLASLLFQ